jgi:hypothetical protein
MLSFSFWRVCDFESRRDAACDTDCFQGSQRRFVWPPNHMRDADTRDIFAFVGVDPNKMDWAQTKQLHRSGGAKGWAKDEMLHSTKALLVSAPSNTRAGMPPLFFFVRMRCDTNVNIRC